MRRVREALAFTLLAGVAGCGGSQDKNQDTVPPIKAPEIPTITVEASSSAPSKPPQKVGGVAISGCNLNTARKRLQSSVYSHRHIRVHQLTNQNGKEITSLANNKQTSVVQAMLLTCRGDVTAIVGTEPQDTYGRTINRVRMIPTADKDAKLYVFKREHDVAQRAPEEVYFGRPESSFPNDPSLGSFINRAGNTMGAAMDDSMVGFQPNDPKLFPQELYPVTLEPK